MHQFIVENAGYEETRLLGSTIRDSEHTATFHVKGWPPDSYEQKLSQLDTFESYFVSINADQTFSVYVRERLTEPDQVLTAAFNRSGLVTVYPVIYDSDGSLILTLVGPGSILQVALEDAPRETDIEVLALGDYDSLRVDSQPQLTDQQFEAVVAAVESGYYGEPREEY